MWNAIHAFTLLLLVGAKDYYSHFTDEKPEIHKLNMQLQTANKLHGQNSNLGRSDSKVCMIIGIGDTKAWSFLSWVLSILTFFLGEREYNTQKLGYSRVTP